MNLKRFFLLALLALFTGSAMGQAFVTATITVTNVPGVGTNWIVNGVTRTWTNAPGTPPQSWITVGASVGATASNLYNSIFRYPYLTPQLIPSFSSTNIIILKGTAVSVTTNNYFSVTYSSPAGTNLLSVVQVPFENVVGDTNRTNNADWIVGGINKYARTNSFNTNAVALSNFLNKGASPQQSVMSPVMFSVLRATNGGLTNFYIVGVSNLSGRVGALTNGYWTNAVLDNATFTNGNVFGTLHVSDGLIVSNGFISYGDMAISPPGAMLSFGTGGAFGTDGSGQLVAWLNSDLSYEALRLSAGSVMTTGTVYGAGIVASNYMRGTNLTLYGTNVWRGDLSAPWFNLATLADGVNNISVPFGTNFLIRISGPTTSPTTICGAIAGATSGGRDGQLQLLWNNSSASIVLAQNAVDPVPANRWANFGGGDVTIQPDGFAWISYATTVSRWKVVSLYPNTNLVAAATNSIQSIQTNGAAPAYVGNLLTNILWTTGVTGYLSGATAVLGINIAPGSSTNQLISTNGTTLGASVGTVNWTTGVTGYVAGAVAHLGVSASGSGVDGSANSNLSYVIGANGTTYVNAATVALTNALLGKVDELNGVATNLTVYSGSPGLTVVPQIGMATNAFQVLNTNLQTHLFLQSNGVFVVGAASVPNQMIFNPDDGSIDIGGGETRIFPGGLSSTYAGGGLGFSFTNSDDNALMWSVTGMGVQTNGGSLNVGGGVTNWAGANIKVALSLPHLTASRVAVLNSTGQLTNSAAVSTTELEFLDGVTSAIQTQLDGKQAIGGVSTQMVAAAIGALTATNIGVGGVFPDAPGGVALMVGGSVTVTNPTTGAAMTFTNGQLMITATNFPGASNTAALVLRNGFAAPTNTAQGVSLDMVGSTFITGAGGSNLFSPVTRLYSIPTVGSSAQTFCIMTATNFMFTNRAWNPVGPWTTNMTLTSASTLSAAGQLIAGSKVTAGDDFVQSATTKGFQLTGKWYLSSVANGVAAFATSGGFDFYGIGLGSGASQGASQTNGLIQYVSSSIGNSNSTINLRSGNTNSWLNLGVGSVAVRPNGGFGSSAIAQVGGTISVQSTPVASAGTSETNLLTYTVPSHTLTNANDRLHGNISGRFAATANAKDIKLIFGSETILDTTSQIVNSGAWTIEFEIVRTGATSQSCWAKYNGAGLSLFTTANAIDLAQTNGIATVLKCTSTAIGDGDVTNRTMTVEWYPTP